MQLSEGTAALKGKCPRCRRGNMFINPLFSFKSQDMLINCPHCGLKFERELGYFYVAMFVSYAMNVAEMLTVGMLTYVVTGNMDSPYLYVAVIIGGILVFSPFNFRYSRIILLYWLTQGLRYEPERTKDLIRK